MEDFLYQRERKVLRNLMLKAIRFTTISIIFAPGFGAKRG